MSSSKIKGQPDAPKSTLPQGAEVRQGEWGIIWQTGEAPKSILARFGHYKISYHIYWTDRNKLVFWYAKLFHNNREIAEFRSPEELENFVLQKGLPSARGLPYLGGE
jgi:hypothetical protein